MRFLGIFAMVGIPALAAWGLLWWGMTKSTLSPRPPLDGAVHPWEEEEDRTRTKRLNAILEEEYLLLVA